MIKYNLTAVQVLILKYLNDNYPKEIIQKDICEYMDLKHSTIISILKRLHAKELITKKTRYKSSISITEKGKDLVKKIGIKTGFMENNALKNFNKEDINTLNSYLDRIYKNILEE